MKRIIILLLMFISVVSCKKRAEEIGPETFDAVSIVPEVLVKGMPTTTNSINHFVVFGYFQEREVWDDVKNTMTANFMYDVNVNKVAGKWVYTPEVYWKDKDLNSHYSFFGYSPRATADNGIAFLTNPSTIGYHRVSYQTLPDVEKQIDLLVSSRINQVPTGDVFMKFSHALTRVGFRAFTNVADTKVKSFKITKLAYKGEVNVASPAVWSNVSPDKTDFAVELNPAIYVSVDHTKPTDLTDQGRWSFILLPQDLTLNTEAVLEIVYAQRGVDITKSYTLKQNLPSGKTTVFEFDLSGPLTGELLVTKVEVTDWSFGGKWDMDSTDGVVEPNI